MAKEDIEIENKKLGLQDIKKELSNDEKVLESAFKLENIYKKHKVKLWSLLILVVAFFGSKAYMEKQAHDKLIKANEAFLILQKDSQNSNALNILKRENHTLYELYSFKEAIKTKDTAQLQKLSKSNNAIISDASGYAESVLALKPNSSTKLYEDMALFQNAYLDIKANRKKEAKNKLELISERSGLGRISQFLKHATLKVN